MRALTIVTALFIAVLSAPFAAEAKLVPSEITYKDKGAALQGYYVYDNDFKGKRPAVLVIHEWWGHNAYARMRADELAKLGYAVFALDMYGKGVSTAEAEKAQELSKPFYEDRALMVRRALAGLDVLKKQPEADTANIASIGYCFGGTVGLELARAGTPLSGVVSFHGGLSTPQPAATEGQIKTKLLVLNGADDPMVPVADRNAFIEEMQKSKADFQFVEYAGAVHAFTNPKADEFKIPGVAYNEKADKRSWELMRQFFAEIFAKEEAPQEQQAN